MATRLQYRRVILHLAQAPVNERVVRIGAELARLLDLELRALFVEDEAVFGLAQLPFGREIRLPAHEWQEIEAERMAAEYEHAAEVARRQVQREAEARGLASAFEVMRGSPAACITTVSRSGGIVVVTGAAFDLAEAFRSVTSLIPEGGEEAPVGVLFVPPGVEERRGVVLAVLDSLEGPSLDVASAIAAAGGESLLVLIAGLPPDAEAEVVRRAKAMGLPESRIAVRVTSEPAGEVLASQLTGVRERLIVMNHDGTAAVEPLARARRVPVLVVG